MASDEPVVRRIGGGRIELVLGSIVDQQADAIVNAANTKLKGGGGVDGIVHRAAGPALREACFQFPADENGRRCPTGQVRTTPAGNLRARHVIHAVGPFYNERYAGRAERLLREVHENSLAAAVAHGCRSVAFPALSTGAYRFPPDRAAAIALRAAADFLAREPSLEVVRFVLYKQPHFDAFAAGLERL